MGKNYSEFSTRWNLPHCCGAIDGKYVVKRTPTRFYNCIRSFIIVLMAVMDYQYCFTYLYVGDNSRASDGGIVSRYGLNQKFEDKVLHLPKYALFVVDDSFSFDEAFIETNSQLSFTSSAHIYIYIYMLLCLRSWCQ